MLTDFNDFWCVKSWEKFDINSLYTCPPHLYTVTTLPWEIPKSHFSTVSFVHACTSDYFRYLGRKQTAIPLPTTPKTVTTLPCKMYNFFIWLKVCYIPPNVGGSEKAGCGLALVALKRTGCDLSLIHIWRCRRIERCRSRWSPYH